MIHLLTALGGYVCAGICLYKGILASNLPVLLLAAVCMAVGNYNIKQYKLY